MKIQVYMKGEARLVDIYEVPDLATTDLNSWPFQEGTDLSFDEITKHVESLKRELKSRPEDREGETQANETPVELVHGSPEDESQSVDDHGQHAVAENNSIPRVQLLETEPVENTHEIESGVEQEVPIQGEIGVSPIQIPRADVEVAEHEARAVSAETASPVSANNENQTERAESDLKEDLRLVRKVAAYLPTHVLVQIEGSTVFKSIDDPTATKLSVNLLFERVVEELRRNHRPPESYSVRIIE